MKRLLLLTLLLCNLLAAQTITDPNFTIDNIASPGAGTTGLDFDSAGRLWVVEKRGRVLVMTPNGSGGFNAPTVFADLTAFVDFAQESGMLGLALDPDFATNRFLYVFYTTPTDQRLVRLQADATFIAWTGSQNVLLSGLPRAFTAHKAGDIDFHPADPNSIYITLGDDGQIGFTENLDYYEGKILKVNKANGEGLLANPFAAGSTTTVRSRIWAIGYRNPFRFAFHPNATTDCLYTSENGGPQNMTTILEDRICWNEIGTSGNWNSTSSNAGDASAFFNPVNPGGQDCIVLGRDRSSTIGIDIAQGGVFADPANPTSSTLMVSNWLTGGLIRRYRLTGASLNGMTAIAADGGNAFVTGLSATDMKFGPDGWLYYTQTNGDASIGGGYRVGRIRRITGTPPSASFSTNPSPAQGNAPLNVQFTDTSTDDVSVVGWSWVFGDGGVSGSQSPSHTYTAAGTYTCTLTVQDNLGLTDSTQITVDVYQTTALTLTGQAFDARVSPAIALAAATELRLYQDDGTTPMAFTGGIGANGNGIAVAAGGAFNVTVNVPIAGSSMVVSAGEPASDGVQARYIGFAVPASPHTQNLTFYLSDTAIWGRITDTGGNPALVDIGVARVTPNALYAFGGGRDYLAASGIPASGVLHRATTDLLGWYYIPVATGDGNVDFYFDAVADTGAATWVSQLWAEFGTAGTATRRDITLGLWGGGGGCDDLSPIAVTANVDYATQIQPIWTAQCAGCHAAGGGSAGLDLSPGGSFAALVNIPSGQVGGLMLVQPGDPFQSYLFEKINCDQPQVGIRMRPGSALSLAEQALIRDWINQGALPVASSGGGGGGGGDESGGGGCAVNESPDFAWLLLAITLALATVVTLKSPRRKLGA